MLIEKMKRNEVSKITENSKLAKIAFDGVGTERKSLYIYGEVYIPYDLYKKHEERINELKVYVSNLEGDDYVETVAKFKSVEKMSLKSIVKEENVIDDYEDVSEWAVEYVEETLADEVESFQTMRLLHKIEDLKLQYSNKGKTDEDLIVDKVMVNGEKVSIRLPKGLTVSVVGKEDLLEDIKIDYKLIQ